MEIQNQSTTKKCPFCAEEILANEINCRHCGESLNKQVDSMPIAPTVFSNAQKEQIHLQTRTKLSRNKIVLILLGGIFFIVALILLSGNVSETMVKNGEIISVDYIGSFENGKIFDTSIEKVAIENNLNTSGRDYKPLTFTVGKRQVIEGFDEGVVGMKVGETKILTIPPEKAYPINPESIHVLPIIQDIPATMTLSKVFDIPYEQFIQTFGEGHNVNQIVQIPETNINMNILRISKNVSLSYMLNVGDRIPPSLSPFSETVVKVDDTNIILKLDVEKGETNQFLQGAPWNSTVIDMNSTNITLRHNAVPDIEVKSTSGAIRVHFNETSIIMDENPEIAGKTLIFTVTLKSIAQENQKSAIISTPTIQVSPTIQRTPLPTKTELIPMATPTPVLPSNAKVVATQQTQIRSLYTGTILKRTILIDGNGELTIKNGLDYDAVAVMTRPSDLNEAVLIVYIRSGNSYTISNIQSGEYYLFYKTGKDWDDSIGRFTMPEESSRFEDKLVYGSSPTGYSATLYPVTGGNAQTDFVNEADFPK